MSTERSQLTMGYTSIKIIVHICNCLSELFVILCTNLSTNSEDLGYLATCSVT